MAAVAFLLLLLAKFFWPFLRFEVPLGYDAGIYRYLFVNHAHGLPPFIIAPMQAWAYEHPLGLFSLATPFLRLGLPVDWLIGWIWNLVPVLLAGMLAWKWGKRMGIAVGVLTLLVALLSQAYFDGFAAMYWKTLLSLAFFVLSIDALERKSWIAVLWGVLTVFTHHQTGLLFGLTFFAWVLLQCLPLLQGKKGMPASLLMFRVLAGVSILILGVLLYAPIWQTGFLDLVVHLFRSQAVGNFPPLFYYVQTTGILLLLGLTGLILNLRKEQGTLWQLPIFISAVFVLGNLFFANRFFLQLDFFLLPFAALAITWLWQHFPQYAARTMLVIVIMVQAVLSFSAAQTREPLLDAETFHSIQALESIVPKGATVIALENQSAPYLLGWLPEANIGGPGLFSLPGWSYAQWETFLMGEHAARVALIARLNRPLYVYAPAFFHDFYQERGAALLRDSCFHPTADPALFSVHCPSSQP